MIYTIPIKQELIMQWGISFDEYAIVFLISKLEKWAEMRVEDNKKYYFATNGKFAEELPMIVNERTIRRKIKKLTDDGIIEKRIIKCRTFYRLTDDKGFKIYEKTPENISNEGGDEIPRQEDTDGLFEKFWYLYPRKANKKEAKIEFEKLSEDDKQYSINSAREYAEDMQDTDKKFISLAKNWILNRLFENYNQEQETQSNKENGEIEKLVYKIRQVVGKYRRIEVAEQKDKFLKTNISEIKTKMGDFLFTENEQKMLLEIGYQIQNYDEIEYQDGEIEINLKGYFR